MKRRMAAALVACLLAVGLITPSAGAQNGDAYDGCGPWIGASYNVVNDPGGAHAQGNADHLLTVGMTWECYYAFSIGHGRLGTYKIHADPIGGSSYAIESLNHELDQAWVLPWDAYYDRAYSLFMAYCGIYGAAGCARVRFAPVGGQQVVQ